MPKIPSTSPAGDEPDALVQSAYQQIKDSILGNRLRPGTKLTHQGLAEMLGVSRTPVRESLERLYQEGYVTRIQNRGHYVAELDAGEVRDLYETREALETFAVRMLFQKGMAEKAAKQLTPLNKRYRKLCEEQSTRERLQLDREFHMTLSENTGNHFLVKTLGGVFDRLILKRRIEGFHGLRGMQPYQEHVRLLSALANNDEAAAIAVMHDHIANACACFTHFLEGEQGAGTRIAGIPLIRS